MTFLVFWGVCYIIFVRILPEVRPNSQGSQETDYESAEELWNNGFHGQQGLEYRVVLLQNPPFSSIYFFFI